MWWTLLLNIYDSLLCNSSAWSEQIIGLKTHVILPFCLTKSLISKNDALLCALDLFDYYFVRTANAHHFTSLNKINNIGIIVVFLNYKADTLWKIVNIWIPPWL